MSKVLYYNRFIEAMLNLMNGRRKSFASSEFEETSSKPCGSMLLESLEDKPVRRPALSLKIISRTRPLKTVWEDP